MEAGCGRVEFAVPIVTLCAGMFLVDVAIERPPVTLDLRHRCATLHVRPGEEPVMGDVYMPSTTRVLTNS